MARRVYREFRMNIELQLTGMTPGGDAIGRYEGRVVFVPFALPGETVEVQIIEERRSFWRGRLLRVIEAAPERVAPRCNGKWRTMRRRCVLKPRLCANS